MAGVAPDPLAGGGRVESTPLLHTSGKTTEARGWMRDRSQEVSKAGLTTRASIVLALVAVGRIYVCTPVTCSGPGGWEAPLISKHAKVPRRGYECLRLYGYTLWPST
jgi:hypothetical protein